MFEWTRNQGGGIWSYLLDNEWQQRIDLNALSERTSNLAEEVGENQELAKEIAEIEHTVAGLALLNRTLLALLTEKGLLTAEEFQAQLKEIEQEDGVHDGR